MVFQISGSLHGIGEKTLVLGASAGWNSLESRIRVSEVPLLRPHPVLALSSARAADDPSLDMALSFDEDRPELFTDRTGHYTVLADPALGAVNYRRARTGAGAALFSGNTTAESPFGTGNKNLGSEGPLIIVPRSREALLFSNRHFKDFSIEFWLYPANMENGEQILSWISSGQNPQGNNTFQRIQCVAAKNRLLWTFLDFFSDPQGAGQKTFSISGSPVLLKTWSHHLIRFDSDTGLLEYLVNGRLEGVLYVTSSGREGGEVYNPTVGAGGVLILGPRFSGLMDEFRVYSRCVEGPLLNKYPPQGGRIETRPIDLGETNSRVLMVEAAGGRTSNPGGILQNEYTGAGNFRFSDNSAIQFFIRAADSPYQWTGSEWRPFEPGAALPESIRGRFVQFAAVFYPSGDGETSPYLDEIRIQYQPDTLPLPPSAITAVAGDGGVDLSWKASPDGDVSGYLVYYGVSGGEYFGDGAILGKSPIDAGKRTSIRIDGLKNGVLYYFAVAAYDRMDPAHAGEFSREVSARPLRMIE
ncbi:MAG: hypothetical protein LBP93_00530 [Treponema sp.]|jgi:hypothetical protein|nr:hypothetical protein [Treponema sp.]